MLNFGRVWEFFTVPPLPECHRPKKIASLIQGFSTIIVAYLNSNKGEWHWGVLGGSSQLVSDYIITTMIASPLSGQKFPFQMAKKWLIANNHLRYLGAIILQVGAPWHWESEHFSRGEGLGASLEGSTSSRIK